MRGFYSRANFFWLKISFDLTLVVSERLLFEQWRLPFILFFMYTNEASIREQLSSGSMKLWSDSRWLAEASIRRQKDSIRGRYLFFMHESERLLFEIFHSNISSISFDPIIRWLRKASIETMKASIRCSQFLSFSLTQMSSISFALWSLSSQYLAKLEIPLFLPRAFFPGFIRHFSTFGKMKKGAKKNLL